ncbi:hypothetical protein ACX9I7_27445 [Streptomyces sp. L500]|uniref:hypothetical protein n=1 Tax=Streptomyces abikoensis TaxID=97398 RepID=UPI0034065D17
MTPEPNPAAPADDSDLARLDLIRCENTDAEEIHKLMLGMTKETYSHEEIFGPYCTLGEHIDVPFDVVFDYLADIRSLEEWSYSMRELRHIGGGLYRGREAIQPNTEIFIRAEVTKGPQHGQVVWPCAWDQGQELWMRYYFTVIDAWPTLRRPGTVIIWTNCRHPYYDREVTDVPEYIAAGRARTDRYWVGDIWPQFDAIHKVEMANLKRILEHRFSVGAVGPAGSPSVSGPNDATG